MTGKKINKAAIQRSAVRAFIYNLVLEVILWAFILFAISKHHLMAILSYELLLHAVILLMLGIYGITLIVFLAGILMELTGRRGGEEGEREKG